MKHDLEIDGQPPDRETGRYRGRHPFDRSHQLVWIAHVGEALGVNDDARHKSSWGQLTLKPGFESFC